MTRHPLLRRLVTTTAATVLVVGVAAVGADLAAPAPTPVRDGLASPGAATTVEATGAVDARVADRPADDGLEPDCPEGFVASPAAGCLRELDSGLAEVAQPDGQVVTVATPHHHAADGDEAHGHGGGDGRDRTASGSDGAGTFAASGSWGLDDVERRPVVCAPTGAARTVAVYAHLEGQARDHVTVRRAIRSVVERSNGLLAGSARDSGGPVADLRFACTSGGWVSVPKVVVPGPEYGEIRQAVVAAGFDHPREKYLVFTDQDSPVSGVSGMAQRYDDDRRTTDNHNNGHAPMHGVVWDGHWDGIVPLHELTHMMGGVQAGAPGSDDGGHCTDGRDLMCPTADPGPCADYAYDCGHDSYFSTAPAPGSHLATHWNVGWAGNRFVDVEGQEADPESEPESESESTAPSPRESGDGDEADDAPDDVAVGTGVPASELVEDVTTVVGESTSERVVRTETGGLVKSSRATTEEEVRGDGDEGERGCLLC